MTFTLGASEIHSEPAADEPVATTGDWPHQRRYPRHPVNARCWVSADSHTAYLRMHDLSLGGLSIGATLPFAPEAEIEVRIELPSGTVYARGQVVWRGRERMGARFTEILSGQQHLEALLAKHSSHAP